jgi:hypothetical protein
VNSTVAGHDHRQRRSEHVIYRRGVDERTHRFHARLGGGRGSRHWQHRPVPFVWPRADATLLAGRSANRAEIVEQLLARSVLEHDLLETFLHARRQRGPLMLVSEETMLCNARAERCFDDADPAWRCGRRLREQPAASATMCSSRPTARRY